jgi:RimJ/RimL family protein N-acetyltransferase
MLPDVRLDTARLLLRTPQPGDFDAFAAMLADPECMKHLGGPQPRPAAWRTFCAMLGGWVVRGFGMFSVVEKATGRWVGRIGPIHPEGWPGPEVGWAVNTDVRGQGYAFEAAIASIDHVFDDLGWTEVIHCIEDPNVRSVALARRLGSEPLRTAKLPPPFETIEVRVWGQSREAWRARRASLMAP